MTKLHTAAQCWLAGFVTGPIAGAGVGTAVFPIAGTVFGAIIGGGVGFVVGVVESAVLLPLVEVGASRSTIAAAGAATAVCVTAPIADGYAALDGWVLGAVLLSIAALGAVLGPHTVAPATSRPVVAGAPLRVLGTGAGAGGGLGFLIGAVVGLFADRSTAWFAAIEVAVAGAVIGALLAGTVIAIRVAVHRQRGRREAAPVPQHTP